MPRYLHLDVFTTTRLEGNQLAVIFEAPTLPTPVMQAVAREMAFSETVFVVPAAKPEHLARIRIFTPARELPMAGHPTVGAAFAFALEGLLKPGTSETVLELGIGPIRVELEWRGDALAFAWMTQSVPKIEATLKDSSAAAAALGLNQNELAPGLPVESISCGLPYLLVPLATRDAVDRASPDALALTSLCRNAGIDEQGVFLFSVEPVDPEVTAYSRMFAPSLGVVEDPATGSASGPLGCYLVRHRLVPPERHRRMVSLQGVKMHRPSRIVMSIEGSPDRITSVRIGGASVLVAEGTLHLT